MQEIIMSWIIFIIKPGFSLGGSKATNQSEAVDFLTNQGPCIIVALNSDALLSEQLLYILTKRWRRNCMMDGSTGTLRTMLLCLMSVQ